MPFNVTAKNLMLDALDESTTGGVKFVGIGLPGTDPGLGTTFAGTEAAGGSPAYARQAVVLGAAAAAVKATSSLISIDVPAGTYAHFLLFNAGTGNAAGNYLGYVPFGGTTPVRGFASCDPTLTNDQLFSIAHGLNNGDQVIIRPVYSEAIPTGLTAGTVYYVVNASANSFKVSTTLGGTAVDITATGGGEVYFEKVVSETYGSQGIVQIPIAALSLDLLGV